jgi:hypothetical protein
MLLPCALIPTIQEDKQHWGGTTKWTRPTPTCYGATAGYIIDERMADRDDLSLSLGCKYPLVSSSTPLPSPMHATMCHLLLTCILAVLAKKFISPSRGYIRSRTTSQYWILDFICCWCYAVLFMEDIYPPQLLMLIRLNISIFFYAPCLFMHHLLCVLLHIMAFLCIFWN